MLKPGPELYTTEELQRRLAELDALIKQAEEYGTPDFASEQGLISLRRHRDELIQEASKPKEPS